MTRQFYIGEDSWSINIGHFIVGSLRDSGLSDLPPRLGPVFM